MVVLVRLLYLFPQREGQGQVLGPGVFFFIQAIQSAPLFGEFLVGLFVFVVLLHPSVAAIESLRGDVTGIYLPPET